VKQSCHSELGSSCVYRCRWLTFMDDHRFIIWNRKSCNTHKIILLEIFTATTDTCNNRDM